MNKLFSNKTNPAESNTQAIEALQESKQAIQQAIQDLVEETRKGVKVVAQEVARAETEKPAAQVALSVMEAGAAPIKLRPELRPHAFVVMPFGKKKGGDGSPYDFNAIYKDLIKPALIEAGFEPFRADEETKSGDILTDMFQELLLADLVICDLSIDNANAFYELGIRHAFRRRGVVHIQAGRAYMPFDIFNVRTLPYHITPEGVPDPAFLDKDRQAIARMTRDTWASEPEAVHSPIFNLLTGLAEPDRKSLCTPLAHGFWREYNEWKERVSVAQRQKRIGDILLLTEEITNPLIKEEAIGEAGKALADLGRNELALIQYQKGLEISPDNMRFRREEAFHLNRLNRVDEAILKVEDILADHPNDSEAIAYLGRIYKETWIDSWKQADNKEKRLRTAFDSYHWLLKAFRMYLKGYQLDLNQFYPGVNAVTLATILVSLADRFDDPKDPDPDIVAVRETLPALRGALEFALETRAEDEQADYWTLISLAELRVLIADNTQKVARAYRKALSASRRKIFYIQSSIQQLEMLQSLDMREEFVQAGLKALHEELKRIQKEEEADTKQAGVTLTAPRVFLFSGYMIDNPKESEKNFPPALEDSIKQAIHAVLDKYEVGSDDVAVTSGLAAGGDILFAECCAERGLSVKVYLPLPDAAYVREFVSPSGESWVERFYKIRNNPLVSERYQVERLGKPRAGDDLYERNNRWTLYSSLGSGIDKLRLIALFENKTVKANARDAHLVNHMVELMREMGGQIEQINPAKLSPIGTAIKNKIKRNLAK
jgi:tetratricopeptide (TPR) repeat protein